MTTMTTYYDEDGWNLDAYQSNGNIVVTGTDPWGGSVYICESDTNLPDGGLEELLLGVVESHYPDLDEVDAIVRRETGRGLADYYRQYDNDCVTVKLADGNLRAHWADGKWGWVQEEELAAFVYWLFKLIIS